MMPMSSTAPAQTAYAKARAGEGPSLIECMTYRHSGHSRADPANIDRGRTEKWKLRDPIKIYRERLRQFGVAMPRSKRSMPACARKSMTRPRSARPRPTRRSDIITTDVYADGGWHGGTDLSRPVIRGIAQEMARDPDVVFLGEDVAKAGGVFKATVGLYEQFGPLRRARHADFGAGNSRRRHGRRDDRLEADRGDHVLGFLRVGASTTLPTNSPKSRYMSNGRRNARWWCARQWRRLAFRRAALSKRRELCMMIPGSRWWRRRTPRDVIGLLAPRWRDPTR